MRAAVAVVCSGVLVRNTHVGWTNGYPTRHRKGYPLPVLVALRGRFTDHRSLFGDRIGLDYYLAGNQSLRFAIAAADGGDLYRSPAGPARAGR